MNRSILIVICDFLLVSLLAFSTVDINKATDIARERTVSTVIATNQAPEVSKDLTAVMRMALDEERRNREQLSTELAHARETASEGTKRAETLQKEIQAREAEAQRLQQQDTNLQQQVSIAQANLAAVSQQLQSSTAEASRLSLQLANATVEAARLSAQAQSSSAEALMSREKLAAMEAESKKQREESAALQQKLQQQEQQMAALMKSNQLVVNEKQQLAGQLQVAEVEKKNAAEKAARAEQQVQTERQEKAKLAEGVNALASKSGELEKEIRENRPLAPNTIYADFVSNRVSAAFSAMRSGLLVDSKRDRDADTVFVSKGTNTYALVHIDDTPFTLWNPGIDWEKITGSLRRGLAQAPINSISFHFVDPRIIIIPADAATVRQLGGKVYHVSSDPYKFQDAVLVGTREGYYGQCNFQIDVTTPDYVKLDRSVLRGLFGKFNPSRGDLVFSKTGELLGIMANSSYCMMLRDFDSAATIRFGQDTRTQHTGTTFSLLYSTVQGMPMKLQ